MDLKMEIYSPELELLDILETYKSVLWNEYAFKAGTFSVESLITDQTVQLLVPDNIIWIEGETAGIIEYIEKSAESSGSYITIKGRLLTGILDRRILWGPYNFYGKVPAIMCNIVDDCAVNPTRGSASARKITGLEIISTIPDTSDMIRKQSTGDSLLEALEELGETNLVAFGVRFLAQTSKMEFWVRPGVDRTVNQATVEPVFYSTELDDVLESEYSYDSNDYKNVAYIAGEGEGSSRVYVEVDEGVDNTGLSRRELFVDARDLQSGTDSEDPLTPQEYEKLLTDRGHEKLAARQLVKSFSATIRVIDPTYVLGEDFYLGDIITVTDERLNLTVDAVVEGVQRGVTAEGETMSLILGHEQQTVYEILKQKGDK